MAKFFFHIRDGGGLIEDTEGLDLPDLESAREEATQAARDIIADRVRDGQPINGQILEIWSHGRMVSAVPFMETIKLR